ncbi:hypothetical protein [Bacillus benzoevorans]|uniref:Uncharacterized protein n=1 Tax=Bacillus benzoevorans TaxID=1456 RepID=A0A7X0LWB6_9BACI|nr:hypothetical protein [Bacillus benzoevorans]MBB6446518.1 hypothetical protein [Bacillus benzoevorans]
MKKLLGILAILLLIGLSFAIITTPIAWIGLVIAGFGFYQLNKQKKRKGFFS